MQSLPSELLYVLMFLAIALFQYLMKRFGPQVPQEPAWDERLEQLPEGVQDVPPAPAVAAVFGGGYSGGSAAPETSLAPPRRRFSRAALLGRQRDVQDAVVVATILGPCRAFAPHAIPGRSAARNP